MNHMTFTLHTLILTYVGKQGFPSFKLPLLILMFYTSVQVLSHLRVEGLSQGNWTHSCDFEDLPCERLHHF